MKNHRHRLIFFGLFFVVLALVVVAISRTPQPSLAQQSGGDGLAYLPITFKPAATPTPPPTPSPNPTNCNTNPPAPAPGSIVVDHTSVALFDHIPPQYIQAAANTDMFFMDRSVGGNIDDGLSCLADPFNAAPNNCKRYEHPDPDFSVDQCVVSWDQTYDRSNWDFEFWQTPGCDQWYDKVDCFMGRANQLINQYDVLSFQFSYLSVGEGSDIADPSDGFFVNNNDRSDVFDLEAFEAQHANKTFIYWTTSLSRGIGSEESEEFNELMREYAQNNNKILFDVADILSHDPAGNPCYDNRDGVFYSNGNNSEDHDDDGINRLAICQHYTTETDGGHLGSVSAGKIRVAKAFWVLMARINGWNGMTQ